MNNSLEGCQIPANPDISGIGVRVSIYAQAALTSIAILIAYADLRLSKKESKTLRDIHDNLLVTSFALLAAAFVQIGVGNLSLFHTIIVLQLCVVNTISVLTLLGLEMWAAIQDEELTDEKREHPKHHPLIPSTDADHWFVPQDDWGLYLACIHASLCSVLGLLTWTRIPALAAKQGCATLFSLAGHSINLLDRKLRIGSIVWYGLFAIPILNFIVFGLFIMLLGGFLCFLITLFGKGRVLKLMDNFIPFIIATFITTVIAQVILIVDTEIMVHRNRPFIADGEGEWSFGQTLALFLLVAPILVTVKVILLQFKGRRDAKPGGKDEESRGADEAEGLLVEQKTGVEEKSKEVLGTWEPTEDDKPEDSWRGRLRNRTTASSKRSRSW